jgi:tRNA G18 (ribose-2'-O)-methylase SpoU
MKMSAGKLRKMGKAPESKHEKNDIYIVLDNVLDTYNVGAVFRLADAVAARKIYLCGYTETPPNPRIRKASINTTELTEWEHFQNTEDAIKDLRLKINDLRIIAVEQSSESIPYAQAEYKLPLALVIGNETHGVSKEVLSLCDQIVELPMFGINVSLNTMVSLAIVLYKIIELNLVVK